MPSPLWLKLFGPNGPTTIRELRDAAMTAPIGEGIGDGSFLARLRALGVIPDNLPQRPPSHVADENPEPGIHGHAALASAVVTGQELAMAPSPAPEAGAGVGPSPEEIRFVASTGGSGASLILNGALPNLVIGLMPYFAHGHASVPGTGNAAGDFSSGVAADNWTKALLQSGPGHMQAGRGPETVALHGDPVTGFVLETPDFIERVALRGGRDFNLIADDANVAAGATLTIDAMSLRAGHHAVFDGSAETDGSFRFLGSQGDDLFLGGAGNDRISGMGGADILSGGGGSDTFLFDGAMQSSGAGYDLLADFDPAVDRIDLASAVSGFEAAIQGGALSTGSFDADLGAALAGLGVGKAVFYAPDSGDLAGSIFLVVDANGEAGYQSGEDYVIALAGTTLADLSAHPGFII